MFFRITSFLAMALLWAGCQRGDPGADGMRLLDFQQAGAVGVLLNESLVFHFSSELDPSSVNVSSARVLDSSGRLVAGKFEVEGTRLVFVPRLAREGGLGDGGFVPGASLQVELSGFPVLSGLRNRSGEVLDSSYSGSFKAVGGVDDAVYFMDSSPDTAQPLYLESGVVGVADPIRIVCEEALDPRSLARASFQLRRYRTGASYEEIPLRARLVENLNDGNAVIELRALDASLPGTSRALEPGEYHLWIDDKPGGLEDLGGHPVRSTWAVSNVPVSIHVELQPGPADSHRHREDFLSRGLSSPVAVAGVDGAAHWGGDGLLRMRWPKSAGDGVAGQVSLGNGTVKALGAARNDLHGSGVTLPEGGALDLSAIEGLVVLRSQTAMRLDGDLTRRSLEESIKRLDDESWGAWKGRIGNGRLLGSLAHGKFDSLDAWIEKQWDSSVEATVLVAGGDLWIDGDLSVDGPLVLAAGGRLRISGKIEAREVWVVGLGGGPEIHPPARAAAVRFAAPDTNSLVVPLTMGALSAPVRPAAKGLRWRSAWVGAYPGNGAVRVRYLGELDMPDGSVQTIGPVEDAALLDRCEAVRIWIELEIEPGQAWDPPMVDFVELHWTEETDL